MSKVNIKFQYVNFVDINFIKNQSIFLLLSHNVKCKFLVESQKQVITNSSKTHIQTNINGTNINPINNLKVNIEIKLQTELGFKKIIRFIF